MVTHALTYIYSYMLCHLHAPRAERSLAVIKKYEGLPSVKDFSPLLYEYFLKYERNIKEVTAAVGLSCVGIYHNNVRRR